MVLCHSLVILMGLPSSGPFESVEDFQNKDKPTERQKLFTIEWEQDSISSENNYIERESD